jgi:hypothetical protein
MRCVQVGFVAAGRRKGITLSSGAEDADFEASKGRTADDARRPFALLNPANRTGREKLARKIRP